MALPNPFISTALQRGVKPMQSNPETVSTVSR